MRLLNNCEVVHQISHNSSVKGGCDDYTWQHYDTYNLPSDAICSNLPRCTVVSLQDV